MTFSLGLIKNMCFLLRSHRLSKGGRVCTHPQTLGVKSLHEGGPLSHKQGSLILQFGVWFSCNLKLYLLLLFIYISPSIHKYKFVFTNIYISTYCISILFIKFGAIVAAHKQNINAHFQNKCRSKKNGAHTARNRCLQRENNTNSKKSVLKKQETTAYSSESIPIVPNMCPQTTCLHQRLEKGLLNIRGLSELRIILLFSSLSVTLLHQTTRSQNILSLSGHSMPEKI